MHKQKMVEDETFAPRLASPLSAGLSAQCIPSLLVLFGERDRLGCVARRLAERNLSAMPQRVFGGTPNTAT